MKKTLSTLMEAVLLLFLIACGTKDAWQEQYDLGMHYLNGGNYQEAVIAFEAAIEIDAKRPKAYLGAAEAYRGMGDADSARKILEQGYAATNDSSLAPSYEAPQIGELYSEDFDYTDSVGNSGHYTYHVPQITADTQGAAAINRAIEDVYGPIQGGTGVRVRRFQSVLPVHHVGDLSIRQYPVAGGVLLCGYGREFL